VFFFFPHYIIYSKILGKKHIADKMFGFFYNFEKYLIVRRIQRYILNLHKSSVIEPVIVVRFERNLNFFYVFEKFSNIKFCENPFNRSRVLPRRRTDMTKRVVAFRNFANGLKNQVSSDGEGSAVVIWPIVPVH
jgi:hypothetical protein